MRKVFVSGVFDLFHCGHVEFLKTAASHGELHVSVGSDATVDQLKKRKPIYSEKERLYLVQSIRYVHSAFIASGSGVLDFEQELRLIHPDLFLVNADGHAEIKERLCRKLGIGYLVLERTAAKGLPARSSTEIHKKMRIPYRIDLAGGWLDQPWVSRFAPGAVITASVEPTHEFLPRSGMATSTREHAVRLWGHSIPFGHREGLAKVLFCRENWPGNPFLSGSQDALGILLPGVNRLYYHGEHWPESIDSICDDKILTWLENCLRLVPIFPRPESYTPLAKVEIETTHVKALSAAADRCWHCLMQTDIEGFGQAIRDSFLAQTIMFPGMVTEPIQNIIASYQDRVFGMKISGAGGGGYLILVTTEDIESTLRVNICRD